MEFTKAIMRRGIPALVKKPDRNRVDNVAVLRARVLYIASNPRKK